MTTGVIYAGAVTAVVICGYLCIAMLVHRYHFEDASITRWMVAYLTLGTWGLPVGLPQKIIWTYDGIAEAFLVEMGAVKRPRVDFAHFFSPEAAPFNMLTAFWITILMLGAALFRRLWRERFAEMILLLVWVIPTILFFGWWEPYHFEYWLGQIVAMWLFSYLVLKSALPKGLPQTGKAVMRVVYLGVICILFATNLRLSIEPRSQYYSFSGASWASETLQRIRMENQRVYQNK
ncbi:MAG: hypothetical protein HY042_11165 [Spirochaetia bacterium]|nr:hypothetical protein [Spirochaetia bacterium]